MGQKLGVLNGKWTILFKASIWVVGFVILFQSWLTTELIAVEKDVVKIQASRFTAEDGLTVWKEIAKVREAIARMPTHSQIEKMQDNQLMMLQELAALKARFPG